MSKSTVVIEMAKGYNETVLNLGDLFGVLKNEKFDKKTLIKGLGIEQVNKSIFLFFRTDIDKKNIIRLAKSKDGFDFELVKIIKDSYKREVVDTKIANLIQPRKDYFDNGEIEIEGVIKVDSGELVFYHNRDKLGEYRVGLALVHNGKSKTITWRTNSPVWESSSAWTAKEIRFVGMAQVAGDIIGYWTVDDKEIFAVVYPSFKVRKTETAQSMRLKLEKNKVNPLIGPKDNNAWEAFNTFNPAAIYEGGKVHILYRAQGFDYVSVIGYAASSDGLTIDERHNEPIYTPKEPFEWATSEPAAVSGEYVSGGGYGGIEDPRATRIDDKIYMTYVAFNGVDPPRVALTSIAVDDFLNHRWMWEKAVLISPPGIVDKSCVIFPEKVRGKYVVMHRIYPNILIDYVNSLNFDGSTWLKGEHKIPPRAHMWDSRKIGAGAPPIRTKDGWLLIYQSVDDRDDKKYLIGAMLLDLEHPEIVLHRSKLPILRPTEVYENDGFKAGVVYPCGAVVIDGTLFVYYGGADTYVCVATAHLDTFLKQLTYNETPTLDPTEIRKIHQDD